MMAQLRRPLLFAACAGIFSCAALVQAAQNDVLEGPVWQLAADGYAYYDARQYALAAERARAAIALRPDVARLHLLLMYALQKQGNLKAADQAGAAALKAGIDPKTIRAARANLRPTQTAATVGTAAYRKGFPIATRAYTAYNKNEYAQAARDAEQAFRIDPTQGRWALLWIDALETPGLLEQASQAVDQALAAGAPNRDDLTARRHALARRMAVPYAEKAFQALLNNQPAQALVPARAAVDLAPESVPHRLLLISVLELNNELEQAENAATIALDQDDQNVVARTLRAYLRQRQNKADLAQADFDSTLGLDVLTDEQRRNTQLIAADAALAAGEPARALSRLETLAPDDKAAQRRRALAAKATPGVQHLSQADYPPPIQDCRDTPYGTVCELLPADESGSGGPATQAYLAYGRHDYAAAIAFARQASELEPDNPSHQKLLTTALASGNRAQAREAGERLEVALAATPSDPQLLMQRGYLRQSIGEPALALQDFQAARATGQAPPSVILDEGFAQSSAGDKVGAVRTLKTAIDQSDQGRLDLDPEQRWNTRNAIAGLDREWGAYVSTGYRGARPASSGLGGAAVTVPGTAVFMTSEIYWRPSAFANSASEIFEVYGRTSNTLHDSGSKTRAQALTDPCNPNGQNNTVQIDSQRNQGGVSGLPSTVGSLGVRYTPSTEVGVTFGLERQFNLGTATRRGVATPLSRQAQCDLNLAGDSVKYKTRAGDGGWLGYVTYGFYEGTGLRQDRSNWPTAEGYMQAGYARQDMSASFERVNTNSNRTVARSEGRLKRDQAFTALEIRAGHSIRLDAINDRMVFFPYLVLGADWLWQKNRISSDIANTSKLSGAGSSWAVGVGPGFNIRQWFREDQYNGPRSYADWTVQYRFNVGGGAAERARGLFMNLTLSY
ncbi:MAG: hypothetical protein WC590_07585 [Burkholderiaceae bacterium]